MSPPGREKPLADEDQGRKQVILSGTNVTFLCPPSTPFSPDLLAIARIVQRARRHSPEPRPMIVYQDLREEVL